MHGHVGLLTDINGSVTDASCPLNTLCHLTYGYQFLKHFPPILDDLHSKFFWGDMPPVPSGSSRLRGPCRRDFFFRQVIYKPFEKGNYMNSLKKYQEMRKRRERPSCQRRFVCLATASQNGFKRQSNISFMKLKSRKTVFVADLKQILQRSKLERTVSVFAPYGGFFGAKTDVVACVFPPFFGS